MDVDAVMGKQEGVTFVYGDFNILHPGHIRFLRFAREQGQHLVVGVLSKAISSGADLPDEVRLESIRSLSCVSEAVLIDDSIPNAIDRLRPSVIVKGKEHEGAQSEDLKKARSLGIKIIFSSGSIGHADSDLSGRRNQSRESVDFRLLDGLMRRRSIDTGRLRKLVNQFSGKRVCVIGDLIIDEYISCEALGMSQEDPTIVVTPTQTSQFLGGAGIVAAHAAALGAEVNLFSVTGNDPAGRYAHQMLDNYGVNFVCPEDPGRPTTVKQRYRCNGKTVFRVSHLRSDSISRDIQSALIDYLMKFAEDADVLIFSDFNYGVVSEGFFNACKNLNWHPDCIQVADSQTSSQIGDLTKFKNLTTVYATEHEARVSLKDKDSGLVVLANDLFTQSKANHLFLKLGGDGVLVLAPQQLRSNRPELIPAVGRAVLDTAGAGDSFLAGSALSAAAGADPIEAAIIGSLAAAIQVSRVGNRPVSAAELNSLIPLPQNKEERAWLPSIPTIGSAGSPKTPTQEELRDNFDVLSMNQYD